MYQNSKLNFKVQDMKTKHTFAIKRESFDIEHPQLHHESVMYDILAGGRT